MSRTTFDKQHEMAGKDSRRKRSNKRSQPNFSIKQMCLNISHQEETWENQTFHSTTECHS